MTAATCVVEGCTKAPRSARRHGMCSMHATRMERHGSLDDPRPSYHNRLMANVALADADACWTWLAPLKPDGYGQTRNAEGRMKPAHRAVYEHLVGLVPDGLHLDHLCRNRGCVNPSHLEPVTPAENTRRGEPANRTHCPDGHAYTLDNTRMWNGKRHCMTCHRKHQANYLARKAAS